MNEPGPAVGKLIALAQVRVRGHQREGYNVKSYLRNAQEAMEANMNMAKSPPPAEGPESWEYKTATGASQKVMNRMAQEGWEPVFSNPTMLHGVSTFQKTTYRRKRRLDANAPPPPSPPPSPSPAEGGSESWEYKAITGASQKVINKMAQAGWEPVFSNPTMLKGTSTFQKTTFRRKKRPVDPNAPKRAWWKGKDPFA